MSTLAVRIEDDAVSFWRRLLRALILPLARLAYPPCAGPLCRPGPYMEHGPGKDWEDRHSIREVCMICGRSGPWIRVIGPFDEEP